jgi:glycosyltransferase involved in cell wall biosynthesis
LFAGIVASEWKSNHGIPYILTEHSSAFARELLRSWQMNLASRAILNANELIAVSPSLADLMSQKFRYLKRDWKWVPNVVSGDFRPNRKNKIPKNRPIRFLNLAMMTENKGQLDLLRSFAREFKNSSRVELWFGGDGPLKEKLKKETLLLGIRDKVNFLGQVQPNEVPELLSRVDAMVIASRYETFGVVAAEALMAGVPVVATRCGGPECIVGENDGILVPPHSPTELGRAMRNISTRFHKIDRSAIAARAFNRFSSEAVADQLSQIYKGMGRRPVSKNIHLNECDNN